MVGFLGAGLHVAAWVCAIVFDAILFSKIDHDKAHGALAFQWGGSFLQTPLHTARLLTRPLC